MSVKTTISISEARKKIFDIASDVQRPSMHYTLTENGRPKAVIMSAEEFESWQETLEVMRDFPDLSNDIRETKRAIKSGAYKRYTALEEILAREGYVLKNGASNRYAISRTPLATSRKRVR